MKDKFIGFLIGFFVCLFGTMYVNAGREIEAGIRLVTMFFLFGGALFISGLCLGAGTMATAKVIIERKKDEE